MKTKQLKKQGDSNKMMDSVVAKVRGAVQVAGATVDEAITIRNEAIDEVENLRTESNTNAGDRAIKKISTDTKKVLGKTKE